MLDNLPISNPSIWINIESNYVWNVLIYAFKCTNYHFWNNIENLYFYIYNLLLELKYFKFSMPMHYIISVFIVILTDFLT